MKEFSLDSTIEEILGEPEGTPPPLRMLELIREILYKLSPDRRYYVDRCYHNTKLSVSTKYGGEFRGTTLPLDTQKDIGYWIIYVSLVLTHHHEWHKGLSVGSVTMNSYDWYPQLADQLRYLDEHPDYIDKVFLEAGVLDKVNEIREILK